MLNEVIIDKDKSLVTWKYNGKEYKQRLENLDQAMISEKLDCIFVLSSACPLPDELHILSFYGDEIAKLSPPKGSKFYYLTTDSNSGVFIVCTFDSKVNGWHDWHYSYNKDTKELVMESPAY